MSVKTSAESLIKQFGIHAARDIAFSRAFNQVILPDSGGPVFLAAVWHYIERIADARTRYWQENRERLCACPNDCPIHE